MKVECLLHLVSFHTFPSGRCGGVFQWTRTPRLLHRIGCRKWNLNMQWIPKSKAPKGPAEKIPWMAANINTSERLWLDLKIYSGWGNKVKEFGRRWIYVSIGNGPYLNCEWVHYVCICIGNSGHSMKIPYISWEYHTYLKQQLWLCLWILVQIHIWLSLDTLYYIVRLG